MFYNKFKNNFQILILFYLNQLNKQILFFYQATKSVAIREANICSLRVCEVLLHLLDFLLDMGLLKDQTTKKNSEENSSNQDVNGTTNNNSQDDNEPKIIELFLCAIIR